MALEPRAALAGAKRHPHSVSLRAPSGAALQTLAACMGGAWSWPPVTNQSAGELSELKLLLTQGDENCILYQ